MIEITDPKERAIIISGHGANVCPSGLMISGKLTALRFRATPDAYQTWRRALAMAAPVTAPRLPSMAHRC